MDLSDKDRVLLSLIKEYDGETELGSILVKAILEAKKDWRYWHKTVLKYDPSDKRHGTEIGYNYGCRCERCVEFKAKRAAKRYETVHDPKTNNRKRPVIRDDGKRHCSVKDAAEDVHGKSDNIIDAC